MNLWIAKSDNNQRYFDLGFDICSLPQVRGNCLAYFPRYSFNSATGACEFFIYGGCQGNANRFETLEECDERCASELLLSDEI